MRKAFLTILITTVVMLTACVNDVDVVNAPSSSTLVVEFTGSTTDAAASQYQSLHANGARELNSSIENESLTPLIFCQVTASWSECSDETFASYTVFRSTNSGISTNPSGAENLGSFDNPDDLEYADNTVDWNTQYYYVVRTTNIADEHAWSNETDIITPTGNPPTPSTLTHSSDATTISLWWTKCPDSNFSLYTLYRSESSGIESDTLSAEKIASFSDCNDLSFDDATLSIQGAYYALRTTNTIGYEAWSDEIYAVLRDSAIVAWGQNNHNQCDVPVPNADFSTVVAGWMHGIGVKADGTIIAWGRNDNGQCDVPSPNSNFEKVAGGWRHSLGLKSDGSVVAWGDNGQSQCDIPSPNSGFTAISAGYLHSLGLKSSGSIVGWGNNHWGQCTAPSPNSGFIGISAGNEHSLGVKSDGSVVGFGGNYFGQCNSPSPNSGFIAVSAGGNHSLGLKSDGSIIAWGWNTSGQCNVPSPNTNFVAIAASWDFSFGLKSDGSIVAWGNNGDEQCTVPQPNTHFTAISAGMEFGLGLRIRF